MFALFLLNFASMMLVGSAVERGKIYQEIWQQIEVPKEAPNWINDLTDPLSEIPFQDYFPGPGEGIDTPSYVERTIQKISELTFGNDKIPRIIEGIKFLYYHEKHNIPEKFEENNAAVVETTTSTTTTTTKKVKRGKISAFEFDDESNATKENKNVTQGNHDEAMEITTLLPDQYNSNEENVSKNQTSTTPSKIVDKLENDDKKDEEHDVSIGNPPNAGGGGGIGIPGVSVGGVVGGLIVGGTIVGGIASGASGVVSGVASSAVSGAVSSGVSSSIGSLSASNVGNSGKLGQNVRPNNQANSRTNNQANSRLKNQKNSNKTKNKNSNKKSQEKQKKDKKKQEKDKDDDDDDFDLDLDELEDMITDDDTSIDQQNTAENISAIFIEQFKRLDDACELFIRNFTTESDDLTEFQNTYSSMAFEVEDIREKLGQKIDEESCDEIYNEKVKVYNEGYLLAGFLNTFDNNVASIKSSFVAYVGAIQNLQFDEYIFKYNITEIVLGSENFPNKIHKDVEKVRIVVKKTHFRLVNCFGESLSTLQNWRTSIESFYQAGVELGKKIFSDLFEQKTFDVKHWSEAVIELTNFDESVGLHSNFTQSLIDLEQTTLDCIYKVNNFFFKKQGPILTAIYNHTY